MMKQINEEVLYAEENIVRVGIDDIKLMKDKALSNQRKRIRLCAHKNKDDDLHDMLIIHANDAYVRPHKHLVRSESIHVIEGKADVIIFDENGNVIEVIKVGDYSSGHMFFFRIPVGCYHSLIIRSNFLVFHEATNGPFNKSESVFAPWSPDENDHELRRQYLEHIGRTIENFV